MNVKKLIQDATEEHVSSVDYLITRLRQQINALTQWGEALGQLIGRKITDKKLCKRLDAGGYGGVGVATCAVFKALPEDLKELGQDFLIRLQILHDATGHWNESGLSKEGKARYEDIKSLFCV